MAQYPCHVHLTYNVISVYFWKDGLPIGECEVWKTHDIIVFWLNCDFICGGTCFIKVDAPVIS